MTVSYFTVSETISGTLWEPQAAGDGVYVAPSVTLISTGAIAFLAQQADVTAQVDGAVIGTSALAFTQGGSIEIGGQGSLTGTSGNAIGVVGAYSISNAGQIDGAVSGIRVDGQGTITNDGVIYGGSQAGVEEADSAADVDRLYNHGTISGPEFGVDDVNGHIAYIYNSGAIDGSAGSFGGGLGAAVFASDQTTEHLYNSGTISGEVDLWAAGSSIANSGQINGDVHLQNGGARVVNKGAIAGDLSFTMTGNFFNGVGGSVTGTIFGDGADGVYYGGDDGETFDMTASGAALVVGGAGLDEFTFRVTGLTAETTVTGGGGADTLKFTTAGKVTASALSHVSGIETIALANGSNAIALTNALVGAAGGASLRVFGGTGADAINASGVTNAADKLTIKGGGGADAIKAGGGEDTFVYAGAADSTSSSYDTISGANFALDHFHLVARSIAAIDPKVTTGSLSTATFNADLEAAIGASKLGAHDAVLFTASAGTLAGQTFLIADLNGIAGYQAGKDLVIHLTAQTGTLTAGSFV